MVRSVDPTSKIVLAHYRQHYRPGSPDALAELILNIMFVRNTMSKEVVTLCKQGQLPWLERDRGKVAEASKKEADQLFLRVPVAPRRRRHRALKLLRRQQDGSLDRHSSAGALL